MAWAHISSPTSTWVKNKFPGSKNYLISEAGDYITTEAGEYIIIDDDPASGAWSNVTGPTTVWGSVTGP